MIVPADEQCLVFVVSGGRTGTQFFGHRMSAVIEDCFSVHEPDMFDGFNRVTLDRVKVFGIWHVFLGRILGLTGARIIGHRRLTGAWSNKKAQNMIRRSRTAYHRSISEGLIVESNAQWWPLVSDLLEVWPNAKVIAIIRDPRTWARSWINKRGRYDDKDMVDYFRPGRLTPARLGEADWTARWGAMDTFGKLAWEWRTIYSHLDESVRKSPNARIFRFEDLFAPDGAAMRDLVNFAADHGERKFQVGDLTGLADTIKNASSGAARDWPTWSIRQAQLLDELCGPLMRCYGYGEELEWQEKSAAASN